MPLEWECPPQFPVHHRLRADTQPHAEDSFCKSKVEPMAPDVVAQRDERTRMTPWQCERGEVLAAASWQKATQRCGFIDA